RGGRQRRRRRPRSLVRGLRVGLRLVSSLVPGALVLLRRLLLAADSLAQVAAVGFGQRRVEPLELGLLLPGLLESALGARQPLELLPVAGDLQQSEHRLSGLRTDTEPVLCALGVDLDQARLLLGLVAADGFDGAAIAACTGI